LIHMSPDVIEERSETAEDDRPSTNIDRLKGCDFGIKCFSYSKRKGKGSTSPNQAQNINKLGSDRKGELLVNLVLSNNEEQSIRISENENPVITLMKFCVRNNINDMALVEVLRRKITRELFRIKKRRESNSKNKSPLQDDRSHQILTKKNLHREGTNSPELKKQKKYFLDKSLSFRTSIRPQSNSLLKSSKLLSSFNIRGKENISPNSMINGKILFPKAKSPLGKSHKIKRSTSPGSKLAQLDFNLLKEIFDSVDANSDGKISFSEIRTYHSGNERFNEILKEAISMQLALSGTIDFNQFIANIMKKGVISKLQDVNNLRNNYRNTSL